MNINVQSRALFLPAELIDNIIDLVRDDAPTLRACARAHRACVPKTRQFLFGVVKVRRDNFAGFADLFRSPVCTVGGAIRAVHLWCSGPSPPADLDASANAAGRFMIADNAQYVPALPSVVKLVCDLRHGSFTPACLRLLRRILPSVADIRADYSASNTWFATDSERDIDLSDALNGLLAFPALQRFHWTVSLAFYAPVVHRIAVPPPRALRAFSIGRPNDCDLDDLLMWFLSWNAHEVLHELNLGVQYVYRVPVLARYLSAGPQALQFLTLGLNLEDWKDMDQGAFRAMADLSHFEALQSLSLYLSRSVEFEVQFMTMVVSSLRHSRRLRHLHIAPQLHGEGDYRQWKTMVRTEGLDALFSVPSFVALEKFELYVIVYDIDPDPGDISEFLVCSSRGFLDFNCG